MHRGARWLPFDDAADRQLGVMPWRRLGQQWTGFVVAG
jgi:hypothetical protein